MKTARQIIALSVDDKLLLEAIVEKDGGDPNESEMIRRAVQKFQSLWKLGQQLGTDLVTITTSEGPKHIDLLARPQAYPRGIGRFYMEFKLEKGFKREILALKRARVVVSILELVRKSLAIYSNLQTWKELTPIDSAGLSKETKVVVLIM